MSNFDPHPRFYALWSINGPLDQSRLRRQMDQLRAAGLDGVVFHPRFYPGQPAYLSPAYLAELSNLILHAKSTATEFWLYDENGWPSGTANGMLLAKHPECAAQRLELFPASHPEALASFWVSPQGAVLKEPAGNAQQWFLVPRRLRALDCLDAEACGRFLSLVHERYRKGLKPEAFDYVSTFFTDEPEFGLSWDEMPAHGAIPWSRHMVAALRERFGHDVLQHLGGLFFTAPGGAEFRIAFWELATDLLCRGFFEPYNAWCRAAGKRFTGHIKGEEHPLFQIPMVGSSSRVLRCIDLPGIDALERFPSNHFYPRQAASVAQQFGDGRCMAEAFGGAGWGATPEDLERYLLWLGQQGMTDFVMHLTQYRLNSAAICDWPPSEPLHLSWREVYPEVLRRVRQKLEKPTAPTDTLIISPHRGIMAAYEPWELLKTNIHNAATYPDTAAARINRAFLEMVEDMHAAGLAYHFTDERTFEELGRSEKAGLRLGKRHYQHVVVSTGAILSQAGRELTARLPHFEMLRPQESPVEMRAGTSLGSSSASVPTAGTLVHPAWSVAPVKTNIFLLSPQRSADGSFVAAFEVSTKMTTEGETTGMEVFFADAVTDVVLNGVSLPADAQKDGTIVRVPRLAGRNHLRFRAMTTVDVPFAWLRGHFRVMSRSVFEPGPAATRKTLGPWMLENAETILPTEFVEAGYPFLNTPLVARGNVECPIRATQLRLEDAAADAAHVSVDGTPIGWTWGPDWQVALTAPLLQGWHVVETKLIPSTFNTYGPHHHFGGDYHVISPDQFRGVKNFIEAADAPAATHTAFWHFKPLHLPRALRFL